MSEKQQGVLKMEKAIVKLDTPELQAIEGSKAQMIRATFEPMAEMLEGFDSAFGEVVSEAEIEITEDTCKKAKRLRIDIGKVRISTEKARKSQKEEYLRAGKAIDGVSNILKWAVSEKENKLKDIENHFENMEKERLEKLQIERAEMLSVYVEDAHDRRLSEMEDDVWDAYIASKKKEYEDMIAAEKAAEKARIEREAEEAKERARIKAENEKLRKEAEEREAKEKSEREERERLAKIEADKRAKEEAERLAKEEEERKEREAAEKAQREAHEAALRKEREERERVERVEREKREKLEAEIAAKEEAERNEREAAEARQQAELKKGDADKVQDLIAELANIKDKYKFKSKKNKSMFSRVCATIDRILEGVGEV
ncbi:MAG: hypothetical protein ACYTBJ_17700 [Planctomycetota bacterium]